MAMLVDQETGIAVSYVRSESADVSVTRESFSVSVRLTSDGNVAGLFLERKTERGRLLLRDIDADGTWDVRYYPDDEAAFIWFDDEWLAIDGIPSKRGESTVARKNTTVYVFRDGDWIMEESEH